jgi:hypothetical protein
MHMYNDFEPLFFCTKSSRSSRSNSDASSERQKHVRYQPQFQFDLDTMSRNLGCDVETSMRTASSSRNRLVNDTYLSYKPNDYNSKATATPKVFLYRSGAYAWSQVGTKVFILQFIWSLFLVNDIDSILAFLHL